MWAFTHGSSFQAALSFAITLSEGLQPFCSFPQPAICQIFGLNTLLKYYRYNHASILHFLYIYIYIGFTRNLSEISYQSDL